MGNEDDGKKHSDQISKQKEALAKARSLVNRPEAAKKLPTSPTLESDYTSPPKFVTYPEFEPVINSKAPLLTLRRLVLLLYLSAGTATTIYAISKLFLRPVLNRLIQARREFYQHSLAKVNALNNELSECDVGGGSPEAQSGNLLKIVESLNQESNSGETAAHNELSFATEDLIVYLNNHIYTSAPFTGYGTTFGAGFGAGSEDSGKNDMITRVKAEIRSVKGAVLNIRNFPSPVTSIKSG